jgi:hypothetical protein
VSSSDAGASRGESASAGHALQSDDEPSSRQPRKRHTHGHRGTDLSDDDDDDDAFKEDVFEYYSSSSSDDRSASQ